MNEPWMQLLAAEVAKTSRTAVAQHLGVSRTTISLVMSGKYGADTGNIATLVMDVLGATQCPHLGQEISRRECQAHASSDIPTSSPRAVRHWRACQTCQNKEA